MSNPIVSAKWLNDNLSRTELIVLDASFEDNKAGLKTGFDGIQIAGSRFFDLINSFSEKDSHLPNMLPKPVQFEKECRKLGINKSSKIVVYDNLGVYSSPRVWWMFRAMGHNNISVLDGGLPDWKSEGYCVEPKSNCQFEQGDFEANFQPEMAKDAVFIMNNLINQGAIVIDARSEGRFKGLAPEPRRELRSGCIPNSINIPFQSVLNNGRFKSIDELTEIFRHFDLKNNGLVFCCGSGLTACIVLLASELVMRNIKSVYDGSWTEWAQLDGQ